MLEAQRATAYLATITRRASDRRARSTFQFLVGQLCAPGSHILDLGCGPGIDPKAYVARGFRVSAYDHDPQMVELASVTCRSEIGSGQLRLHCGDHRDVLREAPAACPVDLVTANFAPLNLIVDLPEAFATFNRVLGRKGQVLVSVLSPYFLGDLKYGWWWQHLPALARTGQYTLAGERGPVIRRCLDAYARAAAPYFTLVRLWRCGSSAGIRVVAGRPGRLAWLRLSSCRFMFLLFRRTV